MKVYSIRHTYIHTYIHTDYSSSGIGSGIGCMCLNFPLFARNFLLRSYRHSSKKK